MDPILAASELRRLLIIHDKTGRQLEQLGKFFGFDLNNFFILNLKVIDPCGNTYVLSLYVLSVFSVPKKETIWSFNISHSYFKYLYACNEHSKDCKHHRFFYVPNIL